jgi:hypothetical protein
VTRTRVIVDTDILSMFAKAGAVHVLQTFLGQGGMAMTPAIHDEIAAPLQYGYTFPTQVLAQVPVVPLTTQVWQEYEHLWTLRSSLGKGELAAAAGARSGQAACGCGRRSVPVRGPRDGWCGKAGGPISNGITQARRGETHRRGAPVAYGLMLAWASANAKRSWRQRAGVMGGGTDASLR